MCVVESLICRYVPMHLCSPVFLALLIIKRILKWRWHVCISAW